MRVWNDAVKHSSNADIALLQAFMNTKHEATFDDLRNDINQFSGLDDGALAQIIQDSGFRHTEN